MRRKTFIVTMREVYVQSYQIQAISAKEALKLVVDGQGDIMENGFEFSHTLDPDTWTVEEEK